MRLLLIVFSILVIIGPGRAEVPKDRTLATVDGVPVKSWELQGQRALMEAEIRRELRDEPERLAKRMAGLPQKLLDLLIEQQLLVNEFSRLRGIVKPEYVDKEIADFIAVHFKRDREAFVNDLGKRKLTLKEFRFSVERAIICKVMIARMTPEIKVTDEQVRDYHAKHKQRWGSQTPESVKSEVANALKQELYGKSVEKVIENLRDKADIQKVKPA